MPRAAPDTVPASQELCRSLDVHEKLASNITTWYMSCVANKTSVPAGYIGDVPTVPYYVEPRCIHVYL